MNGRQGGKLSSAYVQHEPVDVFFDEPSRTRQEFADECDINVLMRRYEATGVISHVQTVEGKYMDLSNVPDLASAIDVVREANEQFMRLPARARARFDNDPVKFVEYAANPDNIEQMCEWGLAERVVDPPPAKVEVVNVNPPVSGGKSTP